MTKVFITLFTLLFLTMIGMANASSDFSTSTDVEMQTLVQATM